VSATIAQGKAAASAGVGRPSGALAADSPVIQSIIATLGGRMLPAQGAVPLYKKGELVGLSAAVARRLNRMRSGPKLAGPRSKPLDMRFGDSTPGTCRDASLQAEQWVLSLSKSVHTRFIHSMSRTHWYCALAHDTSVPMLCGLI
jgi:hypothetical protein